MLRRVKAVEFVRAMISGRTRPLITICEGQHGAQYEFVGTIEDEIRAHGDDVSQHQH
jgi:hypothetical protein